MRELRQNASKVLAAIEIDHEPRVITVNGRPAAVLVPIDVVVDESRGDSITRIGIASDVFAAAMALDPADAVASADAEAWLADIRDADEGEAVVDAWEEAGL